MRVEESVDPIRRDFDNSKVRAADLAAMFVVVARSRRITLAVDQGIVLGMSGGVLFRRKDLSQRVASIDFPAAPFIALFPQRYLALMFRADPHHPLAGAHLRGAGSSAHSAPPGPRLRHLKSGFCAS